MLQDQRTGAPLERWQMCSREEEPLVLQQFLRFGETRPVTQGLILQELSEKNNEEQRARAQVTTFSTSLMLTVSDKLSSPVFIPKHYVYLSISSRK